MPHTVIEKGKQSFKWEAPFELHKTGQRNHSNPLFVYLHGYRQNNILFRKKMENILGLNGYHLFIQGPYPLPTKNRPVEEWGAAWYTYDGDQQKFANSLEHTAKYIDDLLTTIKTNYEIEKTALIGYSMGGYQAGYYALSRLEKVDYLVVLSARIKTELFENSLDKMKGLNILAVHGQRDKSVKEAPQRKEIEKLKNHGVSASLKRVEAGHRLDEKITSQMVDWLLEKGFTQQDE